MNNETGHREHPLTESIRALTWDEQDAITTDLHRFADVVMDLPGAQDKESSTLHRQTAALALTLVQQIAFSALPDEQQPADFRPILRDVLTETHAVAYQGVRNRLLQKADSEDAAERHATATVVRAIVFMLDSARLQHQVLSSMEPQPAGA